jgi:hypothetical protein
MTVEARSDFKTVLRYAKLARLLHDIRRTGPAQYRLDFSGPSSVLHETRRYGVNFARFIPALLSCRDWKMDASLSTPWNTTARLKLTSEDGYSSAMPAPAEFDSSIEEDFSRKFGAEQDGWRLERESAILHEGQSTFIPDFTFRHADGREAFLEIVGFWTPEYLESKRQTLLRFRDRRILIAIARRSLRRGATVPADMIVYNSVLKVAPVIEALARTLM